MHPRSSRISVLTLLVWLLTCVTLSAGAIGTPDTDGDGLLNENDNCPTVANPDQTSIDFNPNTGDPQPGVGDATGDACQNYGDIDFDGVRDPFDNCSEDFNPLQIDVDSDGFGNWCDADFDNNGEEEQPDLDELLLHFGCAAGGPPFDALYDLNGDDCVDAADSARYTVLMQRESDPGPSLVFCADTASPTSPCEFPEDGDTEQDPADEEAPPGDGFENAEDNCPFEFNPDQTDSDHDGFGNRCDIDYNNSGDINVTDFNYFVSCYGADPADESVNLLGKPCTIADFNNTNTVNITDYNMFAQFWGPKKLGPSGLGCAGAPCPPGPFLEPIGSQTVAVGSSLILQLVATDPAGAVCRSRLRRSPCRPTARSTWTPAASRSRRIRDRQGSST